MRVCVHAMVRMWRTEDNRKELVFAFHYVGAYDQTQLTRLDSKDIYIQSHHSFLPSSPS